MKEPTPGYSIQPVHDVLHVRLSGSWNHDQTFAYAVDYKKQVSRYFAREWVCVLNLQDLELLISEQEQIETFRALNTWSYIKGMIALCVVISPENRGHLLYQFEEILSDNQPYQKSIFYSDIEANQWLQKIGVLQPLFAGKQEQHNRQSA